MNKAGLIVVALFLAQIGESAVIRVEIENTFDYPLAGDIVFSRSSGGDTIDCGRLVGTDEKYPYGKAVSNPISVAGKSSSVFECHTEDTIQSETAVASFGGHSALIPYGETGNIVLRPDLVITDAYISGETGFLPPRPVFDITVKNGGDMAVCGFDAAVISPSEETICEASSGFCLFPDGEWTIVCESTEPLASHGNENSITGMASSGNIRAVVDPDNEIAESDESNNGYELVSGSDSEKMLLKSSRILESAELRISEDVEYGRVYVGDGDSLTVSLSAEDVYSIGIQIRDVYGNVEYENSKKCGSGECSEDWNVEVSFGDHGLYFVYGIIRTIESMRSGLDYHSNPGGFRIFVDGWEDNLPDGFDWRDAYGFDWTSNIKSQGNCGSCAPVSVVDNMGMVFSIEQGNPDINLDLSEQNIVSCNEYDNGCEAGKYTNSLKYIIENGVTEESFFRYESGDVECIESRCVWDYYAMECPGKLIRHYDTITWDWETIAQVFYNDYGYEYDYAYRCERCENEIVCSNDKNICSDVDCSGKNGNWEGNIWSVSYYGDLPTDEKSFKISLIERGSFVSIMGPFGHYHRLYDDFVCSDIYYDEDNPLCDEGYSVYSDCYTGKHGVVIVGFKENENICEDYGGYWIIKNSHGKDWNEAGYGKICYNNCDTQNEEGSYFMEGVYHV